MAKARTAVDRELAALTTILEALEGLDGDSIQRVFEYVFSRLSIETPRRSKTLITAAATHQPEPSPEPVALGRRLSIRDLKEQKQPQSSNQMAALVAYYLSEVAEGDERKGAINSTDVSKYFKQAGFKLPNADRRQRTLAPAQRRSAISSDTSMHFWPSYSK